MARKKKEEQPVNTDAWLNTYADMVTLLLCFFVMMYTASVPDETRMQFIMQSFKNLRGETVQAVAVEPTDDSRTEEQEDHPGPDDPATATGERPGVPGAMPLTFDDLYNWVSEKVDASDFSTAITVGMSQGKLHVRFDADIMFAPDSFELLPTGRAALNLIHPGIKAVGDYIDSVEVAGHTAAVPGGGRGGINDWYLSSQRAVTVTDYLDYWARMVESSKFQTAGYAQHHPYLSNEDESTRRRNRRVELVITRNDFEVERTGEIIDMLVHDYGLGATPGGDRHPSPQDHSRAAQVARKLLERYGIADDEADDRALVGSDADEWGPVIPGIPVLSGRTDNNDDNNE
ncbi:MAG: flagellar motor protein MotB [Oscillospiraceae bacterium]|nr:flagellar motor protein MotB [Oscillospiraceae bacterium]